MKKFYTFTRYYSLFLLFFSLFMLQTQQGYSKDLYWVNGSGRWNDAQHWSTESGGKPGAGIPSLHDQVWINDESSENAFTLQIDGMAWAKSVNITEYVSALTLQGIPQSSLTLSTSLTIRGYVHNQFWGDLIFQSNEQATIHAPYVTFKGAIKQKGNGSLLLIEALRTQGGIFVEQGTIKANHALVEAKDIKTTASSAKIEFSNSQVLLHSPFTIPRAQVKLNDTPLKNQLTTSGGVTNPLNVDSIKYTITIPTCNNASEGPSTNGSINITTVHGSTGPFTYEWSGGTISGTFTGNPVTNLGGGVYLVTITDQSDGSQYQEFITVTPPSPIGATFGKVRPTCSGYCNGKIEVRPVGGTPGYIYSWNNGQTGKTNVNLCASPAANSISVSVSDSKGCKKSFSTNLTEPNVLKPNASKTDLQCFNVCNGTASSAPTGGAVIAPASPTYTYSWNTSPTQTTKDITSLCVGTYIVEVKDDSACVGRDTITITQPTALVKNPTFKNVTCNGACNGTATPSISGGTAPYTYSWSDGNTSSSRSNLCPGTYNVTVNDANGCTITHSFIITEPGALAANLTKTNLLCFNTCTGQVVATPSGGTKPYTYSWSNGLTGTGNSSTISSLCANTYALTVTDSNGCSISVNTTVTQPTKLTSVKTITNPSCNAQCNGSGSLVISGGTPSYNLSWSTGATTNNISNLCAGTYTAIITDQNNCKAYDTLVLVEPTAININTSKTDPSCKGVCDGIASASVTGGTPAYTYSWSSGAQTTPSINALCNGTYTVKVTDSQGCTSSKTVTIVEPNQLLTSTSATTLNCFGDCTAQATVSVSGGTAPFNYSWSNGSSNATISNLCAGTYSVNVTDAKGCTSAGTTTINQPPVLTLNTSKSSPTCTSLCNATATANVSGGTAPYTYSWAPGGQTTSSISGLCPGTYTITVRDAKNCTQTSQVIINDPQPLTGSISKSDANCSGQCSGQASVTASGGTGAYTYSWAPGSASTAAISGLCANTYTVTVTDAAGCKATLNTTINQPTPLAANISSSSATCGFCDGNATVSATGGTLPYSYSWTAGGQTTNKATSLCVGTYTVTVTDAKGCTQNANATINQTVNIIITSNSTTLSCLGSCDGIAQANASGGIAPYTYSWSTSPSQTSATATNLCAGTYTVIATDAAGCFSSKPVTFTNPPALNLSLAKVNATCNGTCNGSASVTVTGGTGSYSYSWSNGSVTSNATLLCAGKYYLTVTDANGCSKTDSITISQPTDIVDNPTISPSTCNSNDGQISLAPSGGSAPYTYSWSNGQTTSTLTAVTSGTYSVTITDAIGCVKSFNYTLSNSNAPVITKSVVNSLCAGSCSGQAGVSVSNGTAPYTYSWSIGAQTTASVTNLCAGSYTIQVTDNIGCKTLDTVTILEFNPILPNPTIAAISCNGVCDGSITLSPSGGNGTYTYSWNVAGQTSASLSSLCDGSYSVQITDGAGCDTTASFTITEPSPLNLVMDSTLINCNGTCDGTATVTVTGGSIPYSYSWNVAGSIVPSVVNLCPGLAIVTVSDAKGCSKKDTVNITEPIALTSTQQVSNALCFADCNGTGKIIGNGGTLPYTYSWSPNSSIADSVGGLCKGTYTATITDKNGCTTNQTISIAEPISIKLSLTTTNASCFGSCNGGASVNVSGGTGTYTYSWSGNGSSVNNVSGLCAGTYTLQVLDLNGCSKDTIFSISEPNPVNSNISVTNPSCNANCDGAASASPVGGTGAYTYNWLPSGLTSPGIINLCSNTYTLIVSDANACTDTQTVVVSAPAVISIVTGVSDASCNLCDGSINALVSGGNIPYTFNWAGPGGPFASSSSINNACFGNYTLTVTDSKGCNSTSTPVLVNNTSGPTGASIAGTNVSCYGACDGASSLTPIGGVPPYTYLWNDPANQTGSAVNNLCAGNYLPVITDANTCKRFVPVSITQPDSLKLTKTVIKANCNGQCSGSVSLSVTGGTRPYTYSWNNGSIDSALTNRCPGVYIVTITDKKGCSFTDTTTIQANTQVVAQINKAINQTCANTCDAGAIAIASGGSAPYTFEWNDATSQINDTLLQVCPGKYIVRVQDAIGCYDTASVNIQPAINNVSVSTVIPASCGLCNGEIAVNAPSGSTFIWNNGSVNDTLQNLCAGTYQAQVTTPQGCASTLSVPVANTGAANVNLAVTNTTCSSLNNGSISSTVSGGAMPFTYLWLPGQQTTANVNNLTAGNYTLQVTDNNGCISFATATITSPASINLNTVVTNTACNQCNGSLILNPSGGSSPFTYSWSNGLPASATQTNLCAGQYQATVTDGSGCTHTQTFVINTYSQPVIALSNTTAGCISTTCSSTATALVSGGATPYVYSWSNGQTTANASGLCSGTYLLTVSDASGCSNTEQITIQEPAPLTISNKNIIEERCGGTCDASIAIVAIGGELPLSYSWTPNTLPAINQVNGLCSGTYDVTISDAKGCTLTQSFTLNAPPALQVTSTVVNATCNNTSNGSIDVTTSGGVTPYGYQWSGATTVTSEDLTNITYGTYIVTVTDANSCTFTDTLLVNAQDTVIANAGANQEVCLGSALNLNGSSSVGATTYVWTDLNTNTFVTNAANSTQVPSLATTGYILNVSNGVCQDADTILITVNTLPVIDAGPDKTIVIYGSTTIGDNLVPNPSYNFNWSPAVTLSDSSFIKPIANPTVTTSYTVTVTDANGCKALDSVKVNVLPKIVFPDGISPNNDGVNDVWDIDFIDQFPNCTVEIYNRWGEKLFYSAGYQTKWDGKYKGQDLPIGTYYYIINLNDPLYPDAFTGPITILR